MDQYIDPGQQRSEVQFPDIAADIVHAGDSRIGTKIEADD
jgi:hypothetical protein